MGIGSSKEGFSVFGSLNRCVSPAGKRLLRTWFLRPIVNLKVLAFQPRRHRLCSC